MRAFGQGATTSRITFWVAGAPTVAPEVGTPAASSLAFASWQAPDAASAHSTRTGRRLPSSPCRNGSG